MEEGEGGGGGGEKSGGKKSSFFGKFGVLCFVCFFYLRFEIHHFALLPTDLIFPLKLYKKCILFQENLFWENIFPWFPKEKTNLFAVNHDLSVSHKNSDYRYCHILLLT